MKRSFAWLFAVVVLAGGAAVFLTQGKEASSEGRMGQMLAAMKTAADS